MQTTIERVLRLSSRVYTFRVMPWNVYHNPTELFITVLKCILPLEFMYKKACLKIVNQVGLAMHYNSVSSLEGILKWGCESWTIKKAERQRIDGFELWCWRKLLRVPWTARKSKLSILMEISPEYSLEGLVLRVKLQFFGHLWRSDSLEKILMLGKIEGRRRRGWRGMWWLDGITDSMGTSLSKLQEMVKDRKPWRGAVHEVAKNQIGLGDWTTTISEDTTFTKRAAKVGWMSLLHGTPNAVKRMLPN